MTDQVMQRRGVAVLVCDPAGAPVASEQDALDLIGASFGRAEIVAVPASRLDERFFTLRTGFAGEIMQKFVNYRVRLVIVGDISARIDASTALSDLVRESNRGRQIWFVPTLADLDARLP
jgi:hypothetical protein